MSKLSTMSVARQLMLSFYPSLQTLFVSPILDPPSIWNAVLQEGRNTLHFAAQNQSDPNILTLLLRANVDVDRRSKVRNSALRNLGCLSNLPI